MKKRIFIALIILIAFLSIGVISASEIDVNDTCAIQDSSSDILSVSDVGIGSDSNNLSINNVDANLDENNVGANSDTAKKTVIDAPEINLYYKNGTRFIATLSDIDGNKLANQTLLFTISGVDYSRTTDENGSASVAINLLPGTCDITVSYAGNNTYLDSKTTSKCTVYPNVIGNNVVKYFRNDTQYYATFLDGQGNPLANTNVTFNINGVYYTRTTNGNGVARLNINLVPNTYIITAIHPNGYACSNNITVLSTIQSSDLVKIYRDSTAYYATFLDGQGNPLVNRDVTFNINGVLYTRTTDSSGVARLNINLIFGNYVLTAINPNDGFEYANIVEVLSSSTTSFTTSDYSYMLDDIKTISTILYDQLGHTIPNQSVTISVGGSSYNAVTDGDGVATIDATLTAGTHTISYTYGGADPYKASSTTSTIHVKELYDTKFIVNNTVIYYNNKESFDVTVLTDNNTVVANQPVYFTVNGNTYVRMTNEKGVAKININLVYGVYTISYKFNTTHYKVLSESSQIVVINGNTSTLTGGNMEVYQGAGQKFTVVLKVGETPLPQRNVIININGVDYTRTTNDDGIAQLAINLVAGTYQVKYSYAGEARVSASNGQASVLVKPRIVSSLQWTSSTSFASGSTIAMKVRLLDANNNPLANREVKFTVSSNDHTEKTDSNGVATFSTTLNAGSYLILYSYAGDTQYLPVEGSTRITVSGTQSSYAYGYFVQGRDMNNVDLATLASQGTTDIFLNFYAFSLYGESGVLSWIGSANSYGIDVHIWMQSFYDGDWVNPISGGSVNRAYFNEKINEAKYYASLSGVTGIALDYLRYPGTAFRTNGGTDAITQFVKELTEACYAVNPNILISAIVMPETTDNAYYYGQSIPDIGKYVDVIIPMQYKGNYGTGSDWLTSTTKWFIQNSNGAEVWGCLQSYVSDDDTTKLSYAELFSDAEKLIDGGAKGVILFRFGLSNLLKFNDLDTGDSPVSPGDGVSIAAILNGAAYLKNYYSSNSDFPDYVVANQVKYTLQEFLYLMSKAIVQIAASDNSPIKMVNFDGPSSPSGDVIDGYLTKDEYLDVATRVANFIVSNNWIPNYASSALGKITYSELLDSFSRILDYYSSNGALPANVHIVYSSGSSKSISELAKSLTSGLTSARDKAVALYNYVRDEISYSFYYDTQQGAEGTLASGSANCCDQAQLLVALARSAGLTARFATGYCTFSSGSYGHVWVQFQIDGSWINADPTSTRNSFGVINNWNTATYTSRGTYDVLPY